MKSICQFFLTASLIFFHSYALGKIQEHLCGPYYILNDLFSTALKINQLFNKNDLMLVCGADVPGWRNIPKSQALYHINTILKSSGYYSPKITEDEGKVIIDPGERRFIKKVIFKNQPQGFSDRVFRGIEGKPMTSESLENTKKWALSRLRSIGYPCPEVSVQASFERETLEMSLNPGPKLRLVLVNRPEVEELRADVFKRYDAFSLNEDFNADLLTLSSRRLTDQEITQFSHFEDQCTPDGAVANQQVILGKPKTFIFSFGASTEELPIFKVDWKNTRLDPYGSTLTSSLHLSPRLQALSAGSQLYVFHNNPYVYVGPGVSVKRTSEPTFKALTQDFKFNIGHHHDDSSHRYSFRYTPLYTVEKTLEGEGPDHLQYFSFETAFSIMSHYYEFFRSAPQEGYVFSAIWRAQRDGIGSELSADLIQLEGSYLMNFGKLDPPLYVLGVRYGHSTLLTSDIDLTPFTYRLYLGGADDVRGFSRKSINNDNRGYLTTSYVGLEARFLETLPLKLQPLIIFDAAKVGNLPWTWEQSTYLSPGVGLRWQSPIGAFRSTLAKGSIANKELSQPQPKEEWNFYVSYGSEF